MILTRRRLLQAGGILAGVSTAGVLARPARALVSNSPSDGPEIAKARGPSSAAKRLSLLNLHTAEKLDLVFFRGGDYIPDSLAAIQVLLRDYRNGEQHVIDPKLMDYLYDAAQHIGVDPVFSVISGYRSPQTNEQLRERSNGVARHSLHLEGRAIDVRLAGVECADLAARAREMSRGGVGYYQKSDFVHLDTGAFRTWNG
jgi:uncharacterized protein YcbK (DUF882 family)